MNSATTPLDGKTAIVTGGGRGLGRGIAELLAAQGANVTIAERKAEAAREVEEAVRSVGGEALAAVCDVRDGEQVRSMVARTVERFGGVDLLVNNAGGIYLGRGRPALQPFLETDEDAWDGSYALNLKSALLCTSEAAKVMVRQGRGGSIINVASSEALRAAPGAAAYAAFKAALVNLTRTLALELSEHRIRVNGIAPDGIPTEALLAGFPEIAESYARSIPLGRAGRVEEAAGVVLFLASDLSSFVTGVTVPVEGGMLAAGGWLHHPTKGWTIDPGWFGGG